MKKQEAEVLASEKVDLIIEYITQMLDDSTKLSASMEFNSAKINGQKMCTLDIYVPIKNFERHLNLDIPKDHQNIILKEFLNRILTTFLSHETIGPTKFYQLRSSNFLFDGIMIVNTIGSEIKVNMYGIDKQIADEYNKEYEEYRNSILEDNTSKKRI